MPLAGTAAAIATYRLARSAKVHTLARYPQPRLRPPSAARMEDALSEQGQLRLLHDINKVCVHAFCSVYVHMCVCVRIGACVWEYLNICVGRVHVCARVCMCACVRSSVRACMCLCACVRVIRVGVRGMCGQCARVDSMRGQCLRLH